MSNPFHPDSKKGLDEDESSFESSTGSGLYDKSTTSNEDDESAFGIPLETALNHYDLNRERKDTDVYIDSEDFLKSKYWEIKEGSALQDLCLNNTNNDENVKEDEVSQLKQLALVGKPVAKIILQEIQVDGSDEVVTLEVMYTGQVLDVINNGDEYLISYDVPEERIETVTSYNDVEKAMELYTDLTLQDLDLTNKNDDNDKQCEEFDMDIYEEDDMYEDKGTCEK